MTAKSPLATKRARRTIAGLAGAGLAAVLLLAGCQPASNTVGTASPSNPEPGLSGAPVPGAAPPRGMMAMLVDGIYAKPYFRGVRVVGHSPTGGMQLGWIDHCAYVANGAAGIAVIDVSDPTAPRDVGNLSGRGANSAGENFDVLDAPNGRRIIVVGNSYSAGPGNSGPEGAAYYDIFDATDCEHPRHMTEWVWPEQLHTSHISPNGMRIYGTRIEPFSGKGGIHVLDISDLAHPRYIGKYGATAPDGRTWEFAGHNLIISPDERRIYVGVIGSEGGDFNDRFTSPTGSYSPERMTRDAGGIYILDSSDFATGSPNPKLRLVGRADDAGWHDISMARINGVPHLVAAGELGACPGSWPRITNIADEKHPRVVGEFRLDMNRQENCPPPAQPGAAPAPLPPGIPAAMAGMMAMFATQSQASSHYSSVDSPTHTRLGLFQMTGAGLRIADLRNPANPAEVAYFRPGGGCSGFSRYVPKTEHIWMTCGESGFWVLELTPEVKAALGRR